jgi:integrase
VAQGEHKRVAWLAEQTGYSKSLVGEVLRGNRTLTLRFLSLINVAVAKMDAEKERQEKEIYDRGSDGTPLETFRIIDRSSAGSTDAGDGLFTIILFCGLRWSEAAKLRWENIDLTAGVMRIAEVDDAKKDVVPIPAMVMDWLKQNRKLGGWVFPGRFPDTHVSRLDWTLNKACKKFGIKLNPHLLRHASATLLYEATGDIYAVQHHLRHSKVATTQIYTRFSVEQKTKSMGRLIEHMFNSEKPVKPRKKAV